MVNLSIVLLLTVLVGVVHTLNPYPRISEYHDGDDPGKALFLTEYIERGEIELAKNLSLVKHKDMEWVKSYSGYLTVNKQFNSNMFFWFFPSELVKSNAPVVLWLQGGPGVSSLFGLFVENGPFYVTTDQQLLPRNYSWHKHHNLLYIDNPVGSGYSFTDDEAGYANNEEDVGRDLFEALRQFFTLFSELRENEFYVTGESYGGKYVPALGHTILKKSASTDPKDKINLKGLAIGNGLTDPRNQLNQYGDYLYQLGLIDSNLLKTFHVYEKNGVECIDKKDFICAYYIFDELIVGDETSGTVFKNITGYNTTLNYLKTHGYHSDADASMGVFVQTTETRKAIHVGNYTFHSANGGSGNTVAEHLKKDIMDSVKHWVIELLAHYQVLIYTGQLDISVGYPLTVNYLKKLKFDAADDYARAERYIWKVDDEIAGYYKQAGNLTEVLVRNAGHMVPADQPKWALAMLLRMTTGEEFVSESTNKKNAKFCDEF